MKILFALIIISQAYGLVFKVGAIAPEGTNWAATLKEMADEIALETKGGVKFRFYFGGVAGDEPDVLRKIRVQQFHGGVFTGKTLGDIASDIRAIEIPFNFKKDRAKGFNALTELAPTFNKLLDKNNFIGLGFYEIGQVYVVSTKKVESIQQMKGVKIWSWQGDSLVKAMVDSIGLVSVPLSLPDVLSSLSTGIIDSAYAPALGIIGLQWHNQINYLIDFPTAYSVGALVLDKKRWAKLSATNQKIVRTIAKKYVDKANAFAIEDNKKGLELLKKSGVKFISFSQKDIDQAEDIRTKVIEKVKGQTISAQMIDRLEKLR